MSARGQESVSFLIAVIGALIIIILLTPMINYDIQSSIIVSEAIEAERLIDNLGNAIIRTYLGGNGTAEYVYLGSNLDYNIIIVSKFIAIKYSNKTRIKHVIAPNITEKEIGKGEYLIKNIGGNISVT